MLQRFINTRQTESFMKYFPRVKDPDTKNREKFVFSVGFLSFSVPKVPRDHSPSFSPFLSSLSSHPDSVASITKAGHASRPAVECRRNEVFHPPSFPSPPGGERNRGMWRGQISPVLRVWFVSRGRSLCKKERKRRGRGTFKLGRESRGIRERNRRGGAGIP